MGQPLDYDIALQAFREAMEPLQSSINELKTDFLKMEAASTTDRRQNKELHDRMARVEEHQNNFSRRLEKLEESNKASETGRNKIWGFFKPISQNLFLIVVTAFFAQVILIWQLPRRMEEMSPKLQPASPPNKPPVGGGQP